MRIPAAILCTLALGAAPALADTSSSAGIAGSAPGAPARASLPDIEDEVMCPICGTTLELSNSPQADRERALIRGLISQGKTKAAIKDDLVKEFGPDVLATPSGSGFDLTAWVVPLLALLAAAITLGASVRRWRRSARRAPPEVEAPEGEQAERLDADLGRYDL